MSDFVNTLDILDDDVVVDSIIQGTITEFRDDKIRQVRLQSFAKCEQLIEVDMPNLTFLTKDVFLGCTKLVRANFPNVRNIYTGSPFEGCDNLVELNIPMLSDYAWGAISNLKALKKLDFHVIPAVGGSGFLANCTALKTLILRKTDGITTLKSTSEIATTAIGKGDGYIYVPSTMLATYQAATNWSTYADQFRAIEDYPDICGG